MSGHYSEPIQALEIYREEVSRAYGVYRNLTRSPANKNTTLRFYEFLGIATQKGKTLSSLWAEASTSETALSRVRWLNGPHAHTFYKAWRANHEFD